MVSDGVEDGEELVHGGDESDFGELPGGTKALVEGSDWEIEADSGERGHVEDGANGSSATPDAALSAKGAAIGVEWGNADESGDFLVR